MLRLNGRQSEGVFGGRLGSAGLVWLVLQLPSCVLHGSHGLVELDLGLFLHRSLLIGAGIAIDGRPVAPSRIIGGQAAVRHLRVSCEDYRFQRASLYSKNTRPAVRSALISQMLGGSKFASMIQNSSASPWR